MTDLFPNLPAGRPDAALPELPGTPDRFFGEQAMWTNASMSKYGRLCLARASESAQGEALEALRDLVDMHDHPGNRFVVPGLPECAEWQNARRIVASAPAQAVAPSEAWDGQAADWEFSRQKSAVAPSAERVADLELALRNIEAACEMEVPHGHIVQVARAALNAKEA